MKVETETEEQLVSTVVELRQRIADLEAHETAHKQAEEEYALLKRQFEALSKIAHMGNWDWDVKNNAINWSDELYRIFGLKPQQFGATYEAFLSFVHPDDREIVQKSVDGALREGKPFNVEHRIVRSDGSVRVIHGQGETSFDERRQPKHIIGTAQDITERKQAEEALRESDGKLRRMFNSVAEGIIITDLTRQIVEVNEAAVSLHGYDSKQELIGRDLLGLVAEKDYDRAMRSLERILDGRRIRDIECTFLGRDGAEFDAELSIAVLKDAYGCPQNIIAITKDITERKKAEAQLLAYQKELRYLASQLSLAEERERRRIAIEVHDRISQSLAICKMKLGALVAKARPAGLAEPLSEIHDLVKGLIAETRSLTFDLSSPLLYELGLEAALEQLAEQMEKQHGVQFNFKDDEQPKPLDNDIRVLIFQTVRELLVNIVKHAQARHACIRMERLEGNLFITVQDDGIGFDTSKILTAHMGAKGFGFFNLRERISYIGGHIEIKSECGHGTRVTLTVLLQPA